jgi:predicted nucleotidyltransferase
VAGHITPEQMAEYKRYARAREAQRTAALAQRKERAWEVARRAAEVLKTEFGATRVVVFGSLAHGSWWHESSDIDLAAAGIPERSYWSAWGAVEALSSDIEINLALLEAVKPSILESIAREGVEL